MYGPSRRASKRPPQGRGKTVGPSSWRGRLLPEGNRSSAMRRIRLFHWNATEAKLLIGQLRAAGYTVDYPGDKLLERRFRSLRESPPHAIVIDLTRLPSEGRHLAVAIRSRKMIRSVPIV